MDWEEDGKNINAFKQERLMRGEIEKKNSECWNRDYYFMERFEGQNHLVKNGLYLENFT